MKEEFKNENNEEFNLILDFIKNKMINDFYEVTDLEKFIKEI